MEVRTPTNPEPAHKQAANREPSYKTPTNRQLAYMQTTNRDPSFRGTASYREQAYMQTTNRDPIYMLIRENAKANLAINVKIFNSVDSFRKIYLCIYRGDRVKVIEGEQQIRGRSLNKSHH